LLKSIHHNVEDHFLSFQKGEERGFNYFFHLYYKPLVHFALTVVNNFQTAEDVVEDSLVNLWRKREGVQSASAIKPYLYTSVRNGCINILRKQVNQKAYESYVTKLPKPFAEDVTGSIITSESMHQVYLAVQNLPSKYRQIFNMLYVEGKEVKDIARELNLPLSTVKSQKGRTLELLRKQLPHLGSLLLLLFNK
jgi:RNA polymerase sigma-70 factor (family 1)